MNRPFSPEEIARAHAYYGGEQPNYIGEIDAVDMGEVDSPDSYLGEAGAIDLGEVDAPPDLAAGYYGAPPAQPAAASTPAQIAAAPPTPEELAEEERMRALDAYYGAIPAPGPEVANPSVRQATSFQRDQVPSPPEQTAAAAGAVVRPQRTAMRSPPGDARNADPYGIRAATAKELGTFDSEAAGMRRIADTQDRAAEMLAKRRQLLADDREDELVALAQEQERAERDFAAKFEETQRQLDDVRAKRVDPTRYMRDEGVGVMSVLGGILGGIYQGLNRMEKNPFLEQLNRQIDRDIAAQQAEIDNARGVASDKLNLLAQQRAAFKDSQLAKLQAKNLYYEAAKEHLAAEAQRYEGRIEADRARLGVSTIERAQADLQRQLGTAAKKEADARAAAAAARVREQTKAVREERIKVYDKLVSEGYSPERAEAEALRQVQIDFVGGAPARPVGEGSEVPVSKAGRDAAAREAVETEARIKALQAGYTEVDNEIAKYKKGRPGDITSKLPGLSRIPGTDAQAHALETKKWNARATLLLGPVVEAMNKGKPGAVELHTLQEMVHITPEMTEPEKRSRLETLQALQKDAAAIYERELKGPKRGGVQHLDEKGRPED